MGANARRNCVRKIAAIVAHATSTKLLAQHDLAANGYDSLDANNIVMVTLRQATSQGLEA